MAGVRYKPDLDEFVALSKQGNVVPVCRTLLGDTLTPVSAYEKFACGEYSFLLESAEGGEKLARYSFLGTNPFMVFRARGSEVEIESGGAARKFRSEDPLAELQKQVFAFRAVGVPGLPRFCGGAVGYAAYDAIRYIERLPNPPPDALGLPDLFFAFYDLMVVFDHLQKTVLVICSARVEGDPRRAYEQAVARIDEAVDRLRTPVMKLSDDITPRGEMTLQFRSHFAAEHGKPGQAKAAFCRAVEKCKEYILAGDIFQVVLSQRLSALTQAEPFNVYRALRVINPSPYMFHLHLGELRLVGSSPEVMVKSESGKVTVRPIAGTRPRGATDEEDAALAAELLADPKERAEHIMLLDLGRNDVGRICRYGTVKIEEEMIIERFSHVMHMTSTVTGLLDDGKTCFDAFRNCFPAGTVSGAPKIRAMEILDELEPVKRGPYAGAVGYVDFRGNLDTCIAIRTLIFSGHEVIVQAGAGIVADSVPEREYEETLNKARGLFRAIQVAESLEPA
ncbi:MAG: anthranilate synthase component I [Candidatus Brocadiia bacterium]